MSSYRRPLVRISRACLILCMLVSVLGFSPSGNVSVARVTRPDTVTKRGNLESNGKADVIEKAQSAPLMFIENVGQFDEGARFQVRGAMGGNLWLAQDALWVTILEQPSVSEDPPAETPSRPERFPNSQSTIQSRKGVHLKLSFVDANPTPRLEPFNPLETNVSYFTGNDSAKWHPDVPVWGGVRYADLYPGIDLELTGEDGQWQPQIVAHPGADLSSVRLGVEGADTLALHGGHLRLTTAIGDFTLPLMQAVAADGIPLSPPAFPSLSGTDIDFPFAAQLPGLVNTAIPDPQSQIQDDPGDLLFSTFLGGTGSEFWYLGPAIAVDSAGEAYVTGYTASADFPTTPGAFDTTIGYSDAFVTKMNATGTALVYSTFLGGSSASGADYGYGIAVDAAGAAFVTGYAGSADFPTTLGAFDTTFNSGTCCDLFVTKLNAAGTGLVYSTFLGGTSYEDYPAIAVDAAGQAFVTGVTWSSDFPTTPGAFDTTYNGGHFGYDAFVTKLNATGTGLLYSTFLGGHTSSGDGGDDYSYAIAVDAAGAAHVLGFTVSSDFPTTPGAFDTTFNPSSFSGDAFVTKLNATGTGLVYSTFLGGNSDDIGYSIDVDAAGEAYVAGETGSDDFPITPGAFDTTYYGGSEAFVTKFNVAGTGLVYSTFLGGIDQEDYSSIAVDAVGEAYVTGETDSPDFPTTPGAFDTTYNGSGYDAFVTKLSATGTGLVYSTFLGGVSYEYYPAIAVGAAGQAYVTGYTKSSDFPTTPGAFDTTFNGGSYDAFVTKLAIGGEASDPEEPEENYGQDIPWNAYVADPVNTATGNYAYQRTDLSIPTRSLPLEFTRAYNSAAPQDGLMGFGWTHSYNITATENLSDGSVTIRNGDGREEHFAWDGSAYVQPAGTFSKLEKISGLFRLTLKDQTAYDFDSSGLLADITDRNDIVTTLTYTGGILTGVAAPDGRTLTFTYNAENRLSQLADPLGRAVQFTYDIAGDLTSVNDVTGAITTYAYDVNHRLLSITDANGHTFVSNTYDGEGRVTEQRDALNNLTTFVYDIVAHVTTATDPLGRLTTYQYDSDLRLTGATDALGSTESYIYDADNNRTSVTDKRGNTSNYTYDDNGNVLSITDPLTFTKTFTHDSLSNLLTETDARGNTTSYAYDANSNLIQRVDALSGTAEFGYDGFGQIVSSTDELGRTTGYAYDSFGNQTGITDALGKVTTFTYDNVGRLLSETDPLGRVTSYTYDAANRLLTVTEPLGRVTAYAYDAVGNRTSITDPRGGVTTFAYDAKDRLSSGTDPLSHTTSYAYDAVNNQTSITDPLGHATTYAYNALNRRTSVTDALGKTTTFTFDPNGNRTSVTDAKGNSTSYAYDALNRLTQVTDALDGVVTYSYDGNGNRTGMTDANNHITTYTYDALNRLVTVTDPLNFTTSYSYDAVGNRTGKTKPDGTVITYGYDALNRLTGIAYPGGPISYVYDAVGNHKKMTDPSGTSTYTYDALNRLTKVVAPNGTLNYRYDLTSNRTRVTLPGNKAVNYTYDFANRLTSARDWAGRTTRYTYDNANRQTKVRFPNNAQAVYTYDNADRLTKLVHTHPSSGTIASFTYTLDPVGNRLTMKDLDGTTRYTYDDLHRLTRVIYPNAETVSYMYDPMGNRTSVTSSVGGTTSYTYDAGDRLLTAGSTTFTWDGNGNMTGKGAGTYTYDALDRLTQVVDGVTTAQFGYNGDGVRLSKTVNGTATTYLQDIGAPLPVVVSETTGGQTSRYVYGNDLLTLEDPAAVPTFYHTDGLGSTRALSDSAGQRTDSYTYDVFGSVRSHTGTSAQPFGFAGEQADSEVGLMFLRARYYDPQVGRFLSRDPVAGNSSDPLSLMPYNYARCNPTSYIDPSGKSPVIILVGFGCSLINLYSDVQRVTDPRPVTGQEVAVEVGTFGVDVAGEIAEKLWSGVARYTPVLSCVTLFAEEIMELVSPPPVYGDDLFWGGPPSGGK